MEVVFVTPQSDIGAGTERRKHIRYSLNADIEIEWGSSTIMGQAHDISIGGLFIMPSESLWIGARFAANLLTQPPLKIECTVVRAEPGRGIGVRMALADAAAAAQLEELITNLESSR
jgi:hypothetical protein